MENNMYTKAEMKEINDAIDRINATIDEMNNRLDGITEMLDLMKEAIRDMNGQVESVMMMTAR